MTEEKKVPEEFTKVMKDFVSDIKTTFPEYGPLINKWWKDPSTFDYIDNEDERNQAIHNAENVTIKFLFQFCQKKYPPRFFEILYQNEDIFKDESGLDTEFLPHILFKNLWECDISEKTRETIWKYLQLILFSVVGSISNKEAFGDTAKLFEAIDVSDFKNKLEETLSQMQTLFDMSGNEEMNENKEGGNFQMPDPNELHEHISGMLDGKLGKLAKEIAEETANELNVDMENVTDMNAVFSKLIKNPTKLMSLVKNISNKLDERIKSGEIKESEIMAEASDMMKKMKNMPGMGNIQSMLSKMGMGGLGKVNMGAMESQLNRNMKTAQMKERMKAKAESSKISKMNNTTASNVVNNDPILTEEQIISVFSTGEKVDKTPRGQKNENNSKKAKKTKK